MSTKIRTGSLVGWNSPRSDYGIVIEDKSKYLIFLQEVDPSTHDGIQYDAVEWGCAVTRYPIEDDIVIKEYEDEQIPLDEFLAGLGLERQAPPPEQIEGSDNSGLPICTGWVLFLPLITVVWKKKNLIHKRCDR